MNRRLILPGLLLLTLVAACDLRPRETAPVPAPEPPRPSLAEAIHTGNIAELERLHLEGKDWSWPDDRGDTPLTLAVQAAQLPVIEWLIAREADLRIANADGKTPLHLAAEKGSLPIATALFTSDIDLDAIDAQGQTPAQIAYHLGHLDLVEWLVAAGSSFLLPELDLEDEPEDELTPTAPVRTEGDFRMWTSATGQTLEAEFTELVQDVVVLRSPDDRMFRIPIHRLGSESQILARQLSIAELPSVGRTRRDPSRPGEGRSLARRIGNQKGWEVLEGARWIRHAANDGDSFHVRHDGNHYIFRLYYVDAAETSLAFPQRVHDQAKYFGTTVNETLRLGKDATTFVEKHMAKRPFTVVTRWENARGSSSLPRHYAFIVVDDGDLDELLVEAGLVRIFGMPVDGNYGRLKRRELQRLEQRARSERAGAWKKSSDTAASP
ncbi:MAG TPA: ankyrin repeat domain-containing protein [Kiritimatiellia bacterium]|nr:ankyrin repeat domain-containing protein [Kiritimatiellia bacterium]